MAKIASFVNNRRSDWWSTISNNRKFVIPVTLFTHFTPFLSTWSTHVKCCWASENGRSWLRKTSSGFDKSGCHGREPLSGTLRCNHDQPTNNSDIFHDIKLAICKCQYCLNLPWGNRSCFQWTLTPPSPLQLVHLQVPLPCPSQLQNIQC